MSILEKLGLVRAPKATPSATVSPIVQRVAEALEHFEQERARFIASFAYTLSRVANADLDISEEETRAMRGIVVEHGGLSTEEAELVVEMAKEHTTLFGATQDFLVTREFSQSTSREQKISLLDCLFAVSAADHVVSAQEEQEMKNISRELGLSHKDYLVIRLNYKEHLSVFRKEKP